MAKTGAERQAAYRARQAVEDSGQRRISTWISTDAALALEALADRYGVTLRGAIEMLLLRESEKLGNPKQDKDFSSSMRPRRKRSLLRNDVVAAATVAVASREERLLSSDVPSTPPALVEELLEGSLLHNDFDPAVPVMAEASTETLLRNEEGVDEAAQSSMQTTDASEPARGEQYSLEL